MSFYLRKSIKVGPFRFNLSKSGVGVSAGVTGLRLGTGPRGNYVHMGRGGLYYRKTLPAKQQIEEFGQGGPSEAASFAESISDPGHEALKEIDSGEIRSMVDSSSAELVEELDTKRKRKRWWPFVLFLGVAITIYASIQNVPVWAVPAGIGATLILTLLAAARDKLAKTTVLLYDIEDDYEATYQALHDAFEAMRATRKQWHMTASGKVTDKKRHAGADRVMSRNPISLRSAVPDHVKTNVQVPSIPVGTQTLYFFPDRVLVFERNGVGAVGYENLDATAEATLFIEDEDVPKDSNVVDHTWRYVNKSGGPDKRFNDNKQLPVVEYEAMHFKSSTGLNELINLSRAGVGRGFVEAIRSVSRAVSEQ